MRSLPPGRALELGCGTGANAAWLAERGWTVTAVDFSGAALERARELANERRVSVELLHADVSEYEPSGSFDLVMSFYIELWPEQRRKMLAMSSRALAPGGVLLFVGHNIDDPPDGWSEEDRRALTSPEMVRSELPELSIEKALVRVDEAASHSSQGVERRRAGSVTVVRATRPRRAT